VRTIAESGHADFDASNWYGFVTFAETPAALLERWDKELVKVLDAPEVRTELLERGLIPRPGSRDDMARTMAMATVGRWKDGVMAEEFLFWDNATFMKQIGIGQ
jgi:tripartite-type tricarboxylate transporter receptor subunit TctC